MSYAELGEDAEKVASAHVNMQSIVTSAELFSDAVIRQGKDFLSFVSASRVTSGCQYGKISVYCNADASGRGTIHFY